MLYCKNKGIANENEFIEYFHNKRINELNPMAYLLITKLFPNAKENDIIKTTYRLDKTKSDLLISINDITKKISIKNGKCNSVHLESIETFTNFLRKLVNHCFLRNTAVSCA